MALPRKKSRLICVEGESYRWMVSGKGGQLRLIIESESHKGQKLFAQLRYFELFAQNPHGFWLPTRQAQSLSSGRVRALIELALKQGWTPKRKSPASFYLRTPDEAPPRPIVDAEIGEERYGKEEAESFLSDLRFDLAMGGIFVDLRPVSVGGSVPLPEQSNQPRGLSFSIVREDLAPCGCFNIRVQCDDFPSIFISDSMFYPDQCRIARDS